jgi:hypothetical protein
MWWGSGPRGFAQPTWAWLRVRRCSGSLNSRKNEAVRVAVLAVKQHARRRGDLPWIEVVSGAGGVLSWAS